MPEAKLHRYRGRALTVLYEAGRCIHAAECVRGLPEVFDPRARPWVRPDEAPAEAVAEVVWSCPTGALRLASDGGTPQEPVPEANRGKLVADGPLYLHGRLRLALPSGEVVSEDPRVALCRCGGSANKPFCDGRHAEISFRDPGTAGEPRLDAGISDVGPLSGTLANHGPVLLEGPLEIEGADGTVLYRGERTALCRCGASADKPYCDGSHRDLGFRAP